MTRAFFLTILCLVGVMTQHSIAYEEDTHRELSKVSAELSDLATASNNVLTDFGLSTDISEHSQQKFPNSKGKSRSITELIQDGSDFEDKFDRALNHFYDPIDDLSLHHFILSVLGIDTEKTPDWGLEDAGNIFSQDISYKDAMDFFHSSLTASTVEERNQFWGKTFEALGHVIHLIQDMAQPEHVRNDLHFDKRFGAIFDIYDPSLFESRSLEVFENGVPASLTTYPPVSFPTAREYWTTRVADSAVMDRRGLADFTNRNFVSKDTNFELLNGGISPDSLFDLPEPVPVPSGNNIKSLAELLPDNNEGANLCLQLNQNRGLPTDSPCEIIFIETEVTDSYLPSSETNSQAASLSFFDQYLRIPLISATYSTRSRPPIPEDLGQFVGAKRRC